MWYWYLSWRWRRWLELAPKRGSGAWVPKRPWTPSLRPHKADMGQERWGLREPGEWRENLRRVVLPAPMQNCCEHFPGTSGFWNSKMSSSPPEGPFLLRAVEVVVRSLSPQYEGRVWVPIFPGCALSTQQSSWSTLFFPPFLPPLFSCAGTMNFLKLEVTESFSKLYHVPTGCQVVCK